MTRTRVATGIATVLLAAGCGSGQRSGAPTIEGPVAPAPAMLPASMTPPAAGAMGLRPDGDQEVRTDLRRSRRRNSSRSSPTSTVTSRST